MSLIANDNTNDLVIFDLDNDQIDDIVDFFFKRKKDEYCDKAGISVGYCTDGKIQWNAEAHHITEF